MPLRPLTGAKLEQLKQNLVKITKDLQTNTVDIAPGASSVDLERRVEELTHKLMMVSATLHYITRPGHEWINEDVREYVDNHVLIGDAAWTKGDGFEWDE